MSVYAILGTYCLAIVAASLLGGWIPLRLKLTHNRLQIANSLIGGFMLGVALLHLLPHALLHAEPGPVTLWMTAGVLSMFVLERVFHFHQHDLPSHPAADCDQEPGHSHEHHDDCDHAQSDPQAPHYDGKTPRLSWGGAAIGLVLHSVIAGVGLGAAIKADHTYTAWPGLAILLVIVLHKPFDSMTLLALVVKGGHSHRKAHLINALFALAVPLGAGLFPLRHRLGRARAQCDGQLRPGLRCRGLLVHRAVGPAARTALPPPRRRQAHRLPGRRACVGLDHQPLRDEEPQRAPRPGSNRAMSTITAPTTATPTVYPPDGWHPHDHDRDGVVDH